ncbi:MAG: hypothetical protein WCX65_07110 [bacterium]
MKNWRAASLLIALAFLAICGTTAFSKPASNSKPVMPALDKPLVFDAPVESATAPLTSSGAPESGTPTVAQSTDTYVLWQESVQSCVDKGGPIDIESFFIAVSDIFKADIAGDKKIVRSLRDFMTCRQLADKSQNWCSAEKVMAEPYFAELSVEDQGRFLTKKEGLKVEELIGKAEKECVFENSIAALFKGETTYQGKSLASSICSSATELPEMKKNTDCEDSIGVFIVALEKGDSAKCEDISVAPFKDSCKLFTTKDVKACNSASFKSMPVEQCRDLIATFKIIRNIDLKKDEKPNIPDETFMAVSAKYEENKNYCDSIYREKVLPEFCRAKNLKSLRDLIEQQNKNELMQKRIEEELERLRKEKKEAEEEAKKQGENSAEQAGAGKDKNNSGK